MRGQVQALEQVASKTLTLQNVTSGSNYVAELTYQNHSQQMIIH